MRAKTLISILAETPVDQYVTHGDFSAKAPGFRGPGSKALITSPKYQEKIKKSFATKGLPANYTFDLFSSTLRQPVVTWNWAR